MTKVKHKIEIKETTKDWVMTAVAGKIRRDVLELCVLVCETFHAHHKPLPQDICDFVDKNIHKNISINDLLEMHKFPFYKYELVGPTPTAPPILNDMGKDDPPTAEQEEEDKRTHAKSIGMYSGWENIGDNLKDMIN